MVPKSYGFAAQLTRALYDNNIKGFILRIAHHGHLEKSVFISDLLKEFTKSMQYTNLTIQLSNGYWKFNFVGRKGQLRSLLSLSFFLIFKIKLKIVNHLAPNINLFCFCFFFIKHK